MAIGDIGQRLNAIFQNPETRLMMTNYAAALTDPRSGNLGRAAALGAQNYQSALQQYKQGAIQNKFNRLRSEQLQRDMDMQDRFREGRQRIIDDMKRDKGVAGVLGNIPGAEVILREGTPRDIAGIFEQVMPKPMGIKRSLPGIITRGPRKGERTTALLTDKGIYEQTPQGFRQLPSNMFRQVSTQEQGPSAQLSGLGGTESRQLRDAQVATTNFVDTVGDALQLLQEEPDINTFVGRAASTINNLQTEGRAIADALGLSFDESALDPSSHSESFDQLGIENQRMRSLVTSLAFQAAAASGQSGRSVSDRDVRRFIEEIGASASDPRAFSRTLRDVAERTVRNFQNNYAVRTGRGFQGGFGLEELGGAQQGGGQSLPEGIPEGSRMYGTSPDGNPVYRAPDGQLLEAY